MYTHLIKNSKQRCFRACGFPLRQELQAHEKAYPLMFIEGGQITRVKAENMKKIVRT